jgi:hypothetical protein
MDAPVALLREGAVEDLPVLMPTPIANVAAHLKGALNDLRRGQSRFEHLDGAAPAAEQAADSGAGGSLSE